MCGYEKTQKIVDIDWKKGDGLIPAVVQDTDTGAVLMLGYMNRESLAKTVKTGNVVLQQEQEASLDERGGEQRMF